MDKKFSSKHSAEQLELHVQKTDNWANESYFNYLSRYSNNMVQFSKPIKIDLNFDDGSFHTLYNKYIFEDNFELIEHTLKEDINSIVKDKLYPIIKTKVNIDAEVDPSDFEELISPVSVNFIGKNGKIVSGQTINFDKRYVDLERELTKYISFTKAVDFQYGPGHYFLVGNEPSKKTDGKNHAIWKHILDSRIVDYVDLYETDKIVDYIESENVSPFFREDDAL